MNMAHGRPMRSLYTFATLVCLIVCGVPSAFSRSSGFSKGPHIESGSYGGNLDFYVRAQPASEANGRFLSVMISPGDRNDPTLAFCFELMNAHNREAQILDERNWKESDAAVWLFRAIIDGHATNIIYTVKDNSNGTFTEVLAIADRVFDMDNGRLIDIGTLHDGHDLDDIRQSPPGDAGFVAKMRDVMRNDIAVFNDDGEPEPSDEPKSR